MHKSSETVRHANVKSCPKANIEKELFSINHDLLCSRPTSNFSLNCLYHISLVYVEPRLPLMLKTLSVIG